MEKQPRENLLQELFTEAVAILGKDTCKELRQSLESKEIKFSDDLYLWLRGKGLKHGHANAVVRKVDLPKINIYNLGA